MAEDRVQRKLAAILAADVVGYSRLMGADEEVTLATLKAHRRVIDRLIGDHGGRVFGSAGDSVIAEFASPVEAVRSAVEIQLELHQCNAALPEDRRMRFRIGVNLGDVIVDGDNLMGDGVNVAARLEGLAAPGGLCVSDTVLAQIRDRLSLDFLDLGTHAVKNIARPVRVYRLPLTSEEQVTSPFRGLDVFEYEHADLFFGRARAIATTRQRLEQQAAAGTAFLLIYGMSGAGKSSLVRAGLLPAITRPGAVEGIDLWRYCVIRPSEGPDPVTALVHGLLSETALPELAQEGTATELVELFQETPQRALTPIRAALGRAAETGAASAPPARLVVAIDQMEELFTAEHIDEGMREGFVQLLAVLSGSGVVWVIGTIRADFFHRCAEIPGLSELKDGLGSYELLPPTGPDIAQIIREPARAAGLRFEEDQKEGRLEDVLLQAAARDPASLPLLEFMLDALYEAGKARRLLTFAAYRALGGLEGAIAQRADAVTGALSPEVQDALPAVLRALTTMRLRDQTVTARPVTRAEVAATPAQGELVDALVAARLLVSDESAEGDAVVRIAHEALLSHWPRAREIINANREFLGTRARVLADTGRWLADERNPELLLPPGKRLAEAEEMLQARREELDGNLRGYVEVSVATVRSAEQRKLRRLQLFAGAMAGLAILAGVGGYLGFTGQQAAERQAKVAEVQAQAATAARDDALAAKTDALRGRSLFLADLSRQQTDVGNTTAGILLALEALPKEMDDPDRPYLVETETSLYRALFAHLAIAVLRGHTSPLTSIAFNAAGDQFVTSSFDLTARLWDANTGEHLAVLRGHEDTVAHAAFSPDNSRIVTASWDHTARLWDATSGAEIAILRGHESAVLKAAFSPDNSRIVTVSLDRTARLWDATSGAEIAVLRGHEDAVVDVAFSPDGKLVATASEDGTARLWDAAEGTQSAVLRHSDRVRTVAFSPRGDRVVTASNDGTARLWDTANGAQVGVLEGHGDLVSFATFSPDGSRVVTASYDKTARVWDATRGVQIAVLTGGETTIPRGGFEADVTSLVSAAFSPDGSRVVSALFDNVALLWNADSGIQAGVLAGHDGPVTSAAFSADGRRLVTASWDGTARLWDAADGIQITTLRGHEKAVLHAAFSRDGQRVVTASVDNSARIWDTASGAEIVALHGHDETVVHAAFSADGARVVTASADDTARVWDAASGDEIAVLSGHEGDVRHAVFSPDGMMVATTSRDATARLWDAGSGAEITVLRGHEGEIRRVAFSPDGERVATASVDGTARIWDVASGAEVRVLRGHDGEVRQVAFSPSGDRVVTASVDRTARIWDVVDGTEVAILRGHSAPVLQVAFSPDGGRIVTASRDRTARIWDAASGAELTVLRGHEELVNDAVFSPNGARVITVSRDGTTRLWDAEKGTQIALLPRHERQVWSVAFSPDGKRVLTASADHTARIFNVFQTTQDLIDHAKSIVPRDLTPRERRRFFLPVEPRVGG